MPPKTTIVSPRTLIQIHYHARPGGVTTAMMHYARAFSETGRGAASLIVCGTPMEQQGNVKIICNKALDYRRFASARSAKALGETLRAFICDIISQPALVGPVAVIGHNLSLGKNIALSAAFAEVAREKHKKEVTFFSLIHDFAEEGRQPQMKNIRALAQQNSLVWEWLYPAEATFFSPGIRNTLILKKAGLRAFYLPNPVQAPACRVNSRANRGLAWQALTKAAKEQGTKFMPQRPIFLYPVRGITRKNLAEAVLIVCLICEANLCIGPPGTSSHDIRYYRRIMQFCRRHSLPAIFDAHSVLAAKTTRHWYDCADCVVSTSIAEGFGYAFFEPWLFGKPIVGRRPAGFTPIPGLFLDHLYEAVPVLDEWVRMDRMRKAYQTFVEECTGKSISATEAEQYFRISDENGRRYKNTVDFGSLDCTEQLRVLYRIITDVPALMYMRGEFLPASGIREAHSLPIDGNAEFIRNRMHGAAALEMLFDCMGIKQKKAPKRPKTEVIQHCLYRPGQMRILLSD